MLNLEFGSNILEFVRLMSKEYVNQVKNKNRDMHACKLIIKKRERRDAYLLSCCWPN